MFRFSRGYYAGNQHGCSFVDHPNIDETCLNNHKLHLNKKGIAILASNFVNNIVRWHDSYSTTVATPNSTTTTSARSNSNPNFIFPKGRGFKMASLKITSLLKHIDELHIVLDGQPIDILQSQSKMLGRFCVFFSSQCWCTRFADWIAINNIGREKGSTGKEKKGFALSFPTIFV